MIYSTRALSIALIFAFGIATAQKLPEDSYQKRVDRLRHLLPPHSDIPPLLDLSRPNPAISGASRAWENRFTGSMGVRKITDPGVEEPAGPWSIATTTTEYARPFWSLPAHSCDAVVIARPISCNVHLSYNGRFVYSAYSLETLVVLKNMRKGVLQQNTQSVAALLGGTIRFPSGHLETLILAHNGFMELNKQYVLFIWRAIPSDPLFMISQAYVIEDKTVFPLTLDASQSDYDGMPYQKFEAKVKAAIAKNIDTN